MKNNKKTSTLYVEVFLLLVATQQMYFKHLIF